MYDRCVTCPKDGANLGDGVSGPAAAWCTAALGLGHALGVLVCTAVIYDTVKANSCMGIYTGQEETLGDNWVSDYTTTVHWTGNQHCLGKRRGQERKKEREDKGYFAFNRMYIYNVNSFHGKQPPENPKPDNISWTSLTHERRRRGLAACLEEAIGWKIRGPSTVSSNSHWEAKGKPWSTFYLLFSSRVETAPSDHMNNMFLWSPYVSRQNVPS